LPDADLSHERALLVAAVRDAGALALRTFRGSPRQWGKGASSVVCEADIAVNDLLHERLAAHAPGIGWLSEETDDDPSRLAAERLWIVDPIDGTRAYLAGRDDWVISVALVGSGRPLLAAILAPATGELFLAAAGGGASLNDVQISASPGTGFEGARTAGPKRFLEWLAGQEPGIIATPRIGSLALRLARVAHGQLDVAFAGGNSHDWDLAAADLLVHEAGGMLTSIDGHAPTYNRPDPVHSALVAAGRVRHQALSKLMRGQTW
jgi:myo-inositol-1(or 4)-monophosphatase